MKKFNQTINLNGITWGHSRGYVPMVATAQRFSEINPEITINWSIRSLQKFADQSIEELANKFDLLVIDHPSIGEAAKNKIFIPLDNYLSKDFLKNQKLNSVGLSYESYNFNRHQWALAIDAAAPVAAYRAELFAKLNLQLPETWDELLDLAKSGKVCFAGLQLDCLMHFYSFCINEGQIPFTQDSKKGIVDMEVAVRALSAIRELFDLCGEDSIKLNPIRAYELLATSQKYIYCPLGYGYTNYSRRGYVKNELTFTAPPKRNKKILSTTLGGAGLAISNRLVNDQTKIKTAIEYVKYVASAETQNGLFFSVGGQPGHRKAWKNEQNNLICNNFFKNTLKVLDKAFVRPRHANGIHFQNLASEVMKNFLLKKINAKTTVNELNKLNNELFINEQ